MIQIIGLVELFTASIIAFILTIITYNKYRQRKVTGTLIFMLVFIFMGIVLICIAINRILLSTIVNVIIGSNFPGLVFHNLAVVLALLLIVIIDAFSFEMTYPRHVKVLTIIVSIVMVILGAILMIFQPGVNPSGEVVYAEFLYAIILPIILPPMFIPVVVFLYYAVAIRKTSRPKALRSALMGGATIIVLIGYIFELVGVSGPLTIIVRLFFVIFALIMYICINMPNWFQRAIGWEKQEE